MRLGPPRRSSRKRITPYLPSDLAHRLAGHCATARVTESAAVEAAVRQYLDDTSDKVLIMRRLDRLGRALERAERDRELHTEAFAIFVKLWLAYAPTVSEDARKAALVAADARFRQFMEYLAQRLSKAERFGDLLPHEALADVHELSAVAKGPPQGEPRGNPQDGGKRMDER